MCSFSKCFYPTQHKKGIIFFSTKICLKFLFIFPSYIFGHIYILEIENAVLFYTWKQTFFNLHIKAYTVKAFSMNFKTGSLFIYLPLELKYILAFEGLKIYYIWRKYVLTVLFTPHVVFTIYWKYILAWQNCIYFLIHMEEQKRTWEQVFLNMSYYSK